MPKHPGRHARPKDPRKREPVIVATVAALVVWVGLKFGLPIDDDLANTIAGFVVAAAVAWVRSRVTPTAAPEIPVESMPVLQVTGLERGQTQALLRRKGINGGAS